MYMVNMVLNVWKIDRKAEISEKKANNKRQEILSHTESCSQNAL